MFVVITGASRGIGLELTSQALERGDQVLAVARQPDKSPGLKALQSKFAKQLSVVAADVTDPEAPAKIAAAAPAKVDMLINNAGIFVKGESTEEFLKCFHVNSVVPLHITKALLSKLRSANAPKAIQITSKMGSIADNSSGGSHAYRASKAALNMINKGLAIENEWLTTIVVHPGWVKTDMGGAGAQTETKDSAAGIWRLALEATPKESGQFFDFRGQNIPW